ncbi:MAG: LLM class flavin-dependent oxidoreductase [Dehalococcoidia bacterium]|nr:LLM class flavin-dependent oxidoreductase [Dehalococcoidia bacterium]
MDEALGVILRLFRGETVTHQSDWFTMKEARLQIAPYTFPHMPVAVASTFSPAGPQTAGKHGVGILSVAVSQPGGLISLARTWRSIRGPPTKPTRASAAKTGASSSPSTSPTPARKPSRDVDEGNQQFNKDH